MTARYATEEERKAAQKRSREAYRAKPGVREHQREKARLYMRKKRAKVSERSSSEGQGSASPNPSANHQSSTPVGPKLELPNLITMLKEKYPTAVVPATSRTWESYSSTRPSGDDRFWLFFEPTSESLALCCETHLGDPEHDEHDGDEDFIETVAGRLAKYQTKCHEERLRDVAMARSSTFCMALALVWRSELRKAESKRQRFLGLDLAGVDCSQQYVRIFLCVREWVERGVLYLADAILSLERGQASFLDDAKNRVLLGSCVMRSEG